MDDMPTEAPKLQARLATARLEYRKLVRRMAAAETRAIELAAVLQHLETIINGDAGLPTDLAHPLVREFWDAVTLAGTVVTATYKADRRLVMIRKAVTVISMLLPQVESQCMGIGWKSDIVSLLAEPKSEIELETL